MLKPLPHGCPHGCTSHHHQPPSGLMKPSGRHSLQQGSMVPADVSWKEEDRKTHSMPRVPSKALGHRGHWSWLLEVKCPRETEAKTSELKPGQVGQE